MKGIICPLCSGDAVDFYLKRKDGLPVYLCGSCTLKFISQSDLENLYGSANRLYEHEYYKGQGDIGYDDYDTIPLLNFLWQAAFVQIVEGIRGKRVLDIGCGTGRLLELLMKKGADAEGVEISRHAADIASARGFKVINNDVMSLTDTSTYDVISAFDVIEHIPDINVFFDKIHQLLKENGVFVFLTPDACSKNALTEREKWYGYNSSLEHLYYFSTASLGSALGKVFGSKPVLYQASAPDGQGILGFVRKGPSQKDDAVSRLFNGNFPPDCVDEHNVIPVCILLERLNDKRFIEYAAKYRSFLSANAELQEASSLLSVLDTAGNAAPNITSKSKGVRIRHYQEGDEYGIVRLFKAVFGRDMTIDEWRWKYGGKVGRRVCAVVAVDGDNEIVGHYGGIPLRALYMGREIDVLPVCDVMIHPKHRGFWMLKKINAFFMQDAAKNGFKLCYGFPTEKTLMLPAEKLGIIERCIQISDTKKDVRFHNDLNRFLYRLSPLSFDDRRVDALWENVKDTLDLTVIRNGDYLRWRYGSNPVYSYGLWGLTKRWGNSLDALAVLKKDSTENWQVMDLIFREDALIPLLEKVENVAFSTGKRSLILWLPERYHRELRKHGFTLQENGVIGQFTGSDFLAKNITASLFYFGMGDTDYL